MKMTWLQAEAYFKEKDLVILGTGSTECHGRHLCLGTDSLVPGRILELVEEKRPDLMIAPFVPYGVCDDLTGFAGSISLGPDVFYSVMKKITGRLYECGARRFAVVNGHGGNIAVLERVGVELDRMGARFALLNWWKLAGEINPAWAGGHGGGQETAACLAVDEALVDRQALAGKMLVNDCGDSLPTTGFDFIDYRGVHVEMPRDVDRYAGNGWIGPDDPAGATAEWGREMLAATADFIAGFLGELERMPLPERKV